MRDGAHRLVALDVPWRTLFKVLAAAALVWLWLQLWQLFLVLVVSVVLAITLDPVASWVQRRGLPRWAAAAIVGAVLLGIIVGFLAMTWASISSQARMLGGHLGDLERDVLGRVPPLLRDAIGMQSGSSGLQYAAPMAGRFIRSLASAVVVLTIAFILMVYLLIEGSRTYAWVRAFVPKARRSRVDQTANEARRVIFGYVAGNVATSVFATLLVLIALSLLNVPAALLLALLAGLFDFVPVLGFIISVAPAVLLALTVSPATAFLVVVLYVLYHFIENYFIAPRVYGDALELSNVAVILAFAVGAELAGVVGALIALPIAAAYPAVERIWLREQLGDEVVREHRAIERKAG